MGIDEKDIRRIVQIGDSKGVTFLKGLEETEFPTELGALLELQIEHEDDGPCLKVTPYKPAFSGNAQAD